MADGNSPRPAHDQRPAGGLVTHSHGSLTAADSLIRLEAPAGWTPGDIGGKWAAVWQLRGCSQESGPTDNACALANMLSERKGVRAVFSRPCFVYAWGSPGRRSPGFNGKVGLTRIQPIQCLHIPNIPTSPADYSARASMIITLRFGAEPSSWSVLRSVV